MNRKQIKKQPYVSPVIEVIHTDSSYQLMATSFPNGGHGKAGDDGDEINDAKQGWFDEDEEEEDTPQHWGI